MESSQWPLVLPVTQSGGHGSLVKVFDFDLNSETQVCLGRKNREWCAHRGNSRRQLLLAQWIAHGPSQLECCYRHTRRIRTPIEESYQGAVRAHRFLLVGSDQAHQLLLDPQQNQYPLAGDPREPSSTQPPTTRGGRVLQFAFTSRCSDSVFVVPYFPSSCKSLPPFHHFQGDCGLPYDPNQYMENSYGSSIP